MPPDKLDRYEILREWGHSAVGRVLLARDPLENREVAIQLVETLGDLDAEEAAGIRSALHEAAAALVGARHANLVSLLDVGQSGDLPYVVTEHVEGIPFATYCRPDSLLEPWTVVDLMAGVARGVDELHRSGVVHGDLRPDNLYRVDDTGMVAGVALAPALPHAKGAQIRGASEYLSPEQVRGEPAEARSDVFALGSVLYEMLTGRKAFPGDSISTVLYRIVNEPVADPRKLDRPLDTTVADVVLRALSKHRADRFASCAELAGALDEARIALGVDASIAPESRSGGAAPPPSPKTPPPPAARARRSSLRPFVLGSLLLALIAVALVSGLRRLGGERPPEVVWLETRVRTEPPGLPLRLDGEPFEPGEGGVLRFRGDGPFGVLGTSSGCRTVERRLDPADAGGEVVLVVDPTTLELDVDPAVDGAQVLVNGKPVGRTPAGVELDLCRDNVVELRAKGYRDAKVEIPSGATPLDARTSVYALALVEIPRGKLVLPRTKGLQLVYYVDGERLKQSVDELDLDEGEHELRFKNEYHWIDSTIRVHVEGGKTTTPDVEPRFGTLVVQAFPSNCKVFLRRDGQPWRYLDETPAERRVAVGSYEVKVQLNPTGETRVSKLELTEGDNPPVRVAFGGSR